ncbi:hypothetical protein D3C87_1578650 [compost metagenome]
MAVRAAAGWAVAGPGADRQTTAWQPVDGHGGHCVLSVAGAVRQPGAVALVSGVDQQLHAGAVRIEPDIRPTDR